MHKEIYKMCCPITKKKCSQTVRVNWQTPHGQVEEDLLRAVVTIVVDVDSCSDPTDDERNSTSYQIEPKGT